MTKTTINLTGFRLPLETHLWVYLEGCFRNDLTEEGTPTLKMGNAFRWAGVSRVKKKKGSRVESIHPLFYLAVEMT